MYRYGQFPPYVSIAERRKKAAETAEKLAKKGIKVSPVTIIGRVIAKTFWGKAWCEHLESFSDFGNRIPRGRTYARNGSVIHLTIEKGKIEALVQGSSLYEVKIKINSVHKKKWLKILTSCSGEIESLVELLQGKLSSSVMKTITDKQNGLFPQPNEISLNCSCPDGAYMCKHVAAVLYGVGARLDEQPELLFILRHADHLDLIDKASLKAPIKRASKAKTIVDQDLSSLFGIDIEQQVTAVPKTSTNKQRKPSVGKKKPGKGTPKGKKTVKKKKLSPEDFGGPYED